jgi:hypothetical protein
MRNKPTICVPVTLAFLGLLSGVAASRADEPVRLHEAFPEGYQYHVSTRVELSGDLTLPPEKNQAAPKTLAVSGNSAIEYDERVLKPDTSGQVQKTLRLYRRIDFRRKIGDRPQENTIRPAVRRLVILRHNNTEVPFSPDGPFLWGEIDLVRTDVFTPALAGLLPEQAVRPGERWTAATSAIQELTDMERIDEGQVECRLEEITTLAGRRHARIAFAGTVRGLNEDGPNRQQLDGTLYFDLESNHLSYVSLRGVSSLLDKDGNVQGKIEGRFVLTRQVYRRIPELSDDVVRSLTLEPNAENTELLYDNPELGVRFLYPRRWRVAGVHGPQVALDETNGSGLLLTVEPPDRVPTGAQFLTESRDFLEKQKARILRIDPARPLPGADNGAEHFALDAEVMGQRVLMDYYVVRRATGGVTLAARLLPTDLPALQKEVERVARSLSVTRQK